MAITDPEYAAWLRADNARRCVLVELECYSGGSVVTRYLSTTGYVSRPADTPANTAYDDIVLAVPSVRSAMAEVFRGRSLVSFGELEVDNASGVRDAWLLDAWDGRPARIYLGDPGWARGDFRLAWSGTMADIAARGSRLVLKLRDRQYLLDVPAQTALVTGGTNAGATRPLCYGECLGITPVLRDAPTRVYEVHDGQIEAITAVYQDGAALTLGTQYTVDVSAGTFTMLVSVTGRLTADVRGSKTGGTYVSSTSAIFARIAQERGGLSSGDLDAAALSALASTAPGTVGVYDSNGSTTVRELLDRLMVGAGAWYAMDRGGLLTCGLFVAPAGTPVVTLVDDDIKQAGWELLRRITPTKSVKLGYARNHTVMLSGIAASVSETRRNWLNAEFASTARAINTVTGYLLATDGDLEPTCYLGSADASTEATRRAALWSVLRRVFRLRVFLAAGQVRLGHVVALNLSRYSLGGGALATVIGINESLTGGWQEIEVFL